MRRPEPSRLKDDEERILPMINIVFLLLIFFMVAGRLTAPDPFRIELPKSASEGEADPLEISILVGPDGQLALNGAVMDGRAIRDVVAERVLEQSTSRVRLRADGNVEATRVVEVMEMLQDAGVERLLMLTVSEGE